MASPTRRSSISPTQSATRLRLQTHRRPIRHRIRRPILRLRILPLRIQASTTRTIRLSYSYTAAQNVAQCAADLHCTRWRSTTTSNSVRRRRRYPRECWPAARTIPTWWPPPMPSSTRFRPIERRSARRTCVSTTGTLPTVAVDGDAIVSVAEQRIVFSVARENINQRKKYAAHHVKRLQRDPPCSRDVSVNQRAAPTSFSLPG